MTTESGEIRLMSPKIDFAFKLIFGDSRHKEIPMAFLSAVLKLPRESLLDIEIINSELLREYQEDKKGILDVRVMMRDGRQVNIEIQILPTEFMPERTLYYWSKMYATQIHAGEGYDVLKQCITINIVDFDCTPLNQVHSCYHLTEVRTGHRLTDVLEVHFLELPKLFEKDVDVNPDDETVQWMMFIDSQSREVMEMLAARNPDIGNAFDLLQNISKDEKARMAYEAREAELMDQRTRIKSAHKNGIKKGKAEIIRTMLSRGVSPDDVAMFTGINLDEVLKIQKMPPTADKPE